MYTNLHIFLQRFEVLTEEEIAAFISIFKPMEIRKLDHLFVEGERVSRIYFLNEGIMRGYLHTATGEVTSNFYFGPTMFADLMAVRAFEPTKMNVQALKDAFLMQAEMSDLDDLIALHPRMELIFFKFLEHLYLFGLLRQHSFIFDSPQERYLKLFNDRPKVIAEIPQRFIASYLGMTPETLSRVRKRIFKEL